MTKPKEGSKRFKRAPALGGRPHRLRVQLTDAELRTLQMESDTRGIGMQEILVESYFARGRRR